MSPNHTGPIRTWIPHLRVSWIGMIAHFSVNTNRIYVGWDFTGYESRPRVASGSRPDFFAAALMLGGVRAGPL